MPKTKVIEFMLTAGDGGAETLVKDYALLMDKEKFEIIVVVLHALDSLEIKNSASHSEIKIAPDGSIRIIEIGGRMGGDCIGSDLVKYSTGIDYVRAVIQVACGLEPDLNPVSAPQPVRVHFIFTQDDLQAFESLHGSDKLLKVVDYHPENIGKTTDSSNRAGCYITKA